MMPIIHKPLKYLAFLYLMHDVWPWLYNNKTLEESVIYLFHNFIFGFPFPLSPQFWPHFSCSSFISDLIFAGPISAKTWFWSSRLRLWPNSLLIQFLHFARFGTCFNISSLIPFIIDVMSVCLSCCLLLRKQMRQNDRCTDRKRCWLELPRIYW